MSAGSFTEVRDSLREMKIGSAVRVPNCFFKDVSEFMSGMLSGKAAPAHCGFVAFDFQRENFLVIRTGRKMGSGLIDYLEYKASLA